MHARKALAVVERFQEDKAIIGKIEPALKPNFIRFQETRSGGNLLVDRIAGSRAVDLLVECVGPRVNWS
jgi:hypothetical protein